MKTVQFKTNIKCSGCLTQVSPFLNDTLGADNWDVDIQSPDKVLTAEADDEAGTFQIIKAVEQAGFKAEVIQ